MTPMRIGVLALQGAFREHVAAFTRLGAEAREVRLPQQLEGLDGVTIPGGESTTMAKLMAAYGLDVALRDFHAGGGVVWGTCAGAIVVARDIEGHPEQPRLGLMDMTVARNAYGRQVASFEADLAVAGLDAPFHAVFIRAPGIRRVGEGLDVWARWDGQPVAVAGNRVLATVFHPELTPDGRIHRAFLERLVAPAQSEMPALLRSSARSAR